MMGMISAMVNCNSMQSNVALNFQIKLHNVHIAVITETFLKSNVKLKSHPHYVVHRLLSIVASNIKFYQLSI